MGRSRLWFQQILPTHSRHTGVGLMHVRRSVPSLVLFLVPCSELSSARTFPPSLSLLPRLQNFMGTLTSTSRTLFRRHVFVTLAKACVGSSSDIRSSSTRPTTCGSYVSSSPSGVSGMMYAICDVARILTMVPTSIALSGRMTSEYQCFCAFDFVLVFATWWRSHLAMSRRGDGCGGGGILVVWGAMGGRLWR